MSAFEIVISLLVTVAIGLLVVLYIVLTAIFDTLNHIENNIKASGGHTKEVLTNIADALKRMD